MVVVVDLGLGLVLWWLRLLRFHRSLEGIVFKKKKLNEEEDDAVSVLFWV